MVESEAKHILETDSCYECSRGSIYGATNCGNIQCNVARATNLAINALEKQIPKNPKITRISCGISFGICPNCGKEINRLDNPFYHTDKDCLQKLDWSEV